jgi:hypothetical protein
MVTLTFFLSALSEILTSRNPVLSRADWQAFSNKL